MNFDRVVVDGVTVSSDYYIDEDTGVTSCWLRDKHDGNDPLYTDYWTPATINETARARAKLVSDTETVSPGFCLA